MREKRSLKQALDTRRGGKHPQGNTSTYCEELSGLSVVCGVSSSQTSKKTVQNAGGVMACCDKAKEGEILACFKVWLNPTDFQR